jgi:hypothetical protein
MSDDPPLPASPDSPRFKAKAQGTQGEASREDRLKAALKANMARRKAQARARAAGEAAQDNEKE